MSILYSPWRNFWTGYSQWIGSTERCWLSFQSSEDSPVPSCTAAWSPSIRAFLFVTCVAAFFFFHSLSCTVWEGLLWAGKMGSWAAILCYQQLGPRSQFNTLKRPVVLRYRPGSCCVVARQRSAVKLTLLHCRQGHWIMIADAQFMGISRDLWGEELLNFYYT